MSITAAVNVYAWIPHLAVINPDPFSRGQAFGGDGWRVPPERNCQVPGTYRAHQVLEIRADDWNTGRFVVLRKATTIGRSHALERGAPVLETTATPNSRTNLFQYVTFSRSARFVMKMDVGIPLTSAAALTPDIEWDLDLFMRADGTGVFTFVCKGFPSYCVYASHAGKTIRLFWQDVSSVDPYSPVAVGHRLAARGHVREQGYAIR